MKLERLRLIPVLSIIVIALVLGACHQSDNDGSAEGIENAAEAIEKALAPREVELVIPEIRDEKPSVEFVGEIRAFDVVPMSSEVGGKVDRVLVEVGDRVAKGAPLIEVDRETFALYQAQAEGQRQGREADLALAEKDLERKRDLRSDETIPQASLDQAQAGLRARQRRGRRRGSISRSRQAQLRTERHSCAGRRSHHRTDGRGRPVGRSRRRPARCRPERQSQNRRPSAGVWVGRFSNLESFTFTVGDGSTVHTAKIYSCSPWSSEASRSFEIVGTAVERRYHAAGDVRQREADLARLPPHPVAAGVRRGDIGSSPGTHGRRRSDRLPQRVQIGRRDDGTIEIVNGLNEGEQVILDVSGLTRGLPVTIVG